MYNRASAIVIPHALTLVYTRMRLIYYVSTLWTLTWGIPTGMPSKMDCEEPWEVQLLREFCGSELSLEEVRVYVVETRLGVFLWRVGLRLTEGVSEKCINLCERRTLRERETERGSTCSVSVTNVLWTSRDAEKGKATTQQKCKAAQPNSPETVIFQRKIGSLGWDLNLRPSAFQAMLLPTELPR